MGIYNEGLKNMMESADSMKRDAKRMNLSSSVNLPLKQNLSSVMKKINLTTEQKLKSNRSTTSQQDILSEAPSNDSEMKQTCSLQEIGGFENEEGGLHFEGNS